MKKNIFVSYTIRDNVINVEFLRKIKDILDVFGKPFIDLLHNDSFNKQNRIEKELAKSDCLILINTIKTKESEWVIKELSIANQRRIPIHEFDYEDLVMNKFQSMTKCISRWAIDE